MAFLYVTEFASDGASVVNGAPISVALVPPVVDQSPVGISGAAAASAAFNGLTAIVRVHNDSTSACCVAFGVAPVATTNNMRLSADQTEYFRVPKGAGFKVSVIATA